MQQMATWKSHLNKLPDLEVVSDCICLVYMDVLCILDKEANKQRKPFYMFPKSNIFTFTGDNCLEKPIFSQQPAYNWRDHSCPYPKQNGKWSLILRN